MELGDVGGSKEAEDELPGKMEKIDVKEPPPGHLAMNSALLPSSVARLKPISAAQDPIKGPSASKGSATGNPRNKTALAPGHSLMDWIRLGASNVDLTGVGGVHQAVTPAELARHNCRNDAWIAIRGVVFNVTRYMDFHPGGVDELMKGVGIDATRLFDNVHAWVNYQSILQKCIVGRLTRNVPAEIHSNSLISLKTPLSPVISPQFRWKQTTNTLSLTYTTPSHPQPLYVLEKTSPNELTLQITTETNATTHEFDLSGAVHWSPTWTRSFDNREVEFCFSKVEKTLWTLFGSRTISSRAKTARKFRSWQVISNTALCSSVVLLVLRADCFLEVMPIGSFVEARMKVGGVEISRPYTPVPAFLHPEDEAPNWQPDCMCLMVKRRSEGAFSPTLVNLKPGERVELTQATGGLAVDAFDAFTAVHMLAGGSGLTPMLGIIQWALSRRCVAKINLLNFNHAEDDIFYGPQLTRVTQEGRFQVTNILSQADESWTGRRGMISERLIQELVGDSDRQGCVFVCGPKLFIDTAKRLLGISGWQSAQVHTFDG